MNYELSSPATNKRAENELDNQRSADLLKKFGKYGFLFFLLKGLLWLVVASAAYFGITNF